MINILQRLYDTSVAAVTAAQMAHKTAGPGWSTDTAYDSLIAAQATKNAAYAALLTAIRTSM